MATVSISVTCLPAMRSTLTELSARLATSARLPARLIDRPEGCLPTVSVSISLGGVVLRSITNRRLSGTCRRTPFSSTTLSELATSASVSPGVIARLTGGPAMVLSSCRLPTSLGASGSVPMSSTCTVSRPIGARITAPASLHDCFSSLATSMSWRCAVAGVRLVQPETAASAARARVASAAGRNFMGRSPCCMLLSCRPWGRSAW